MDNIISINQHNFLSQSQIDNATFSLSLNPSLCVMPEENDFFISIKVYKYISSNFVLVGQNEYNTEITSQSQINGSFEDLNITNDAFGPGLYQFELTSRASQGSFTLYYVPTYLGNEIVGGLRIKKVTTSDGSSLNNIEKSYTYFDPLEPTLSSGILLRKPSYGRTISGIQATNTNVVSQFEFALLSEESVVPLTTLEGYHIYYKNVEESFDNGNNGTVRYEFDTENATISNRYPTEPGNTAVKRNKLLNSKVFSNTNSLIKESEIIPEEPDYVYSSNFLTSYLAFTFAPQLGPIPPGTYHVGAQNQYNLRSGVYQVKKQSETVDNVTTTTDFEYDAQNRFVGPIAQYMTNSDNKVHRTEYTYPHDVVSSSIYLEMWQTRNMILPIKTEQKVNGILVSGTNTQYSYFSLNSGGLHPKPSVFQSYEAIADINGTILSSGSWVNKATVNSYSPVYGKASSFTLDGWTPELYNWTTSGRLLSKMFGNFEHEYTFHPGTSLISTIKDIDGQLTCFEYDELSRLSKQVQRKVASVENVKTDLTYHYKQASGDVYNWVNTKTTYT
ncbi:MAG: hypothetical protein WBO36_13320, partial [Saprospiraceae bacterium]